MKKYGLIAAVTLLVLVNIFVLLGVGRNRSGAPEAEFAMTERELPLMSSQNYLDKEDTGLSLRIDWSQSDYRWKRGRTKQYDWFDQSKLEAIGFDVSVPLDGPKAALYYDKMLPRKTYAVLEYEGKAWEAWRANVEQELANMAEKVKTGKERKNAFDNVKKDYARELKTRSRLFAVDVGNDPVKLREQYSDRHYYIITPALARLSYSPRMKDYEGNEEPPRLQGSINELLIDEINVPREMRDVLEALLARERKQQPYAEYSYSYAYHRERGPSYTVTLRYGRRYEPWVVDIQSLESQQEK